MDKIRPKSRSSSPSPNRRRTRPAFLEEADRRTRQHLNQPGGRRRSKSMAAAINASMAEDEEETADLPLRALRWSIGVLLLPLCWVTAWTFLARFSRMTLNQGFWHSAEFWYFATGALLMAGWFASGLLKTCFLFLYVLGHELTHAVFVLLWRGKVTDFHVSTEGGYITTNKTNVMIALSPYFVPWWSVVTAFCFVALRLCFDLAKPWELAFYGLMGLTWTFHIVWTAWMIPRDQPDLRENGTFLSLVIILLGNLVVLVALLCVADSEPWQSFKEFCREWLKTAATGVDVILHGARALWAEMEAYARFRPGVGA